MTSTRILKLKPRARPAVRRAALLLVLGGGLVGMEAADGHTRAAVARSLMPAFLAQGLAADTLRLEERAFLFFAGCPGPGRQALRHARPWTMR